MVVPVCSKRGVHVNQTTRWSVRTQGAVPAGTVTMTRIVHTSPQYYIACRYAYGLPARPNRADADARTLQYVGSYLNFCLILAFWSQPLLLKPT